MTTHASITLLACAPVALLALLATRVYARRTRRYVRLGICPYRTDSARVDAVVAMFEALHKRLVRRWWRRLVSGQPSITLEVHVVTCADGARRAALAVACPDGMEREIAAALRTAYPNTRLKPWRQTPGAPTALVRLKKRQPFIKRLQVPDTIEFESPTIDELITTMAAAAGASLVQLALTPAPASFESHAKRLYRRHEAELARRRDGGERRPPPGPSQVDDRELAGGLDVQHRALFFGDIRVVADGHRACELIAAQLRSRGAENQLVQRGVALRQRLARPYDRRIARGEGNPLPAFRRGVYASTELAALWQLPRVDFAAVPLARHAIPIAPAPPAILRPARGDRDGLLLDSLGPVAIHAELRRQNTAVTGTVEQGKTSHLVATVRADLRRDRCAVIVLDPKGDAADAALSLVPESRPCTLLDLGAPTCGFNPLSVDAPADAIADYVVAAIKQLFVEGDIRGSSDRYLRNAIIAALAVDRAATLWDVARLLAVTDEGHAFRAHVAPRLRALPEFKEIAEFFADDLERQLADARATTTSKLDAPANKLARVLNSSSVKRVLLNDSLRIDLDRVIASGEVLVVKGALGEMGIGNVAVLMQLLVGMLDAALARQQDAVEPRARVAVALKIDEAPLVINAGFAQTLALKRSAGLETVACWQSDAQWREPEVRDQLDALFAHRVYFATASAADARAAAGLLMAEYSDQLRPGLQRVHELARPDVRLHLPKHHAIVSWTTPDGRQAPFIARTLPIRVDRERLAAHARRQAARGARLKRDLRQPHWDTARPEPAPAAAPRVGAPTTAALGAPPPRAAPGPPPPALVELVEIDAARSVRWSGPSPRPREPSPDAADTELLAWIARWRHVLASQAHRRFNPERDYTVTQRRLKRLWDAGLVRRCQFHRADGGGAPMCYTATPTALELLEDAVESTATPRETSLRAIRGDVHVAAWMTALEALLGDRVRHLRGPRETAVAPPGRAPDSRRPIGPRDLRLPGGRAAHGFLRTQRGARVECATFAAIAPCAAAELRIRSDQRLVHTDLFVELELDFRPRRTVSQIERYDHMISGWCVQLARYAERLNAPPAVVLICRDADNAREYCRAADPVMTACRAYAGEYPHEWRYVGRSRTLFVAEREIHEGSLAAYALPPLPPAARVELAGGDPDAARCDPQTVELVASLLASA